MAEILVTDFLTGIMIFLRISAMFVVAPIYNSDNIPVLVRLALALIITYIAFFSIDSIIIQKCWMTQSGIKKPLKSISKPTRPSPKKKSEVSLIKQITKILRR